MKLFSKNSVGAVVVLALLAWVLVPPPQLSRAQFQSQQTFIAHNVGGTANAVSLTIDNVNSYANILGVPISFFPNTTNTGPVTINVNGLGSTTLLRLPTGAAMGGGELIGGGFATITFTGAATALLTSVQDTTPVGTAIDIRGSVAPAGYLIEDGTCVSQTTYAALFTVIGTSYGSCSAGLFAVPDSRGRLFVASDSQGSNGAANRITNAGSGCTATSVPFSCGSQNVTVSTTYLPASGLSVPGLSVPSLTTSAVSVPGLSVPGLSVPGLSIPSLTTSANSISGTASIPVANLTSVAGATDTNRISLKNNANTDAGLLSTGTSLSGTAAAGTTGTGTTGTGTTGTGTTGTGTTGTGTTGTGTTGGGTTGNMGSGTNMPILNPLLGGLRAVKY